MRLWCRHRPYPRPACARMQNAGARAASPFASRGNRGQRTGACPRPRGRNRQSRRGRGQGQEASARTRPDGRGDANSDVHHAARIASQPAGDEALFRLHDERCARRDRHAPVQHCSSFSSDERKGRGPNGSPDGRRTDGRPRDGRARPLLLADLGAAVSGRIEGLRRLQQVERHRRDRCRFLDDDAAVSGR